MPDLLHRVRELIRNAHADREPRVLGTFAGGGSVPLEALRSGREAATLSLNPTMCWATQANERGCEHTYRAGVEDGHRLGD
jgi:adenine-specific DNA methylase